MKLTGRSKRGCYRGGWEGTAIRHVQKIAPRPGEVFRNGFFYTLVRPQHVYSEMSKRKEKLQAETGAVMLQSDRVRMYSCPPHQPRNDGHGIYVHRAALRVPDAENINF